MATADITPGGYIRNKGKQCTECSEPASRLGFCEKHYLRNYRRLQGKPEQPARDSTIKQRLAFYSAPNADTGCIEWTASLNTWGYGRLSVARQRVLAHRLAYEEYVGPVPDGLLVLHSCDNPKCINPAHLFLGTDLDNSDDKIAKGRAPHVFGDSHACSRLTARDVLAIRADSRDKRAVAAQYGISPGYVYNIRRRLTWKHLP